MARTGFDFPSNSVLVDDTGNISAPWMAWVQRVHDLSLSLQRSGTTANRPISNLWIGLVYFDTTLGKPVWLKSVGPSVWVDGVGTVS
jgi:hypothetical protein